MEQEFYKNRLHERHGLQVIVPTLHDREIIHRVIYEELCLGKIVDESRSEFRRVIADLVRQGVQAIVLGCTELSLLVGQQDSAVPLFDTTRIHARKAAERALSAT
jgi:aspartate racemase